MTLDCGGTLDFAGPDAGYYRGKRISVGLRPEGINILPSDATAVLTGKIEFLENLGEVQILYVDLPGSNEQSLIKTAETAPFAKQSEIAFRPKTGALYYFDESGKSIAS